MKISVHKFGGSILRDKQSILNVAKKIKDLYLNKEFPVVVASALHGKTDYLLKLAHNYSLKPDSRELDMLLSCGEQESIALLALTLKSMGVPAISRNASQVKISTDAKYQEACLKKIDPELIRKDIKNNKVPIIAGFQGITPMGDWTTLGRGGSDLTAIAITDALKAHACKIYTNVEGIYTTDPQYVETATMHRQLHYDIMLEMATCGAHVMQAKAVEFAKRHQTPFEVLSYLNNEGTQVGDCSLSAETLFAIQAEDHLLQYSVRIEKTKQPLIFKILEAFSDNAITIKSFSTDYHSGKTTLICHRAQEQTSEHLLLETLKKHLNQAQLLKEEVSQMHLIHGPRWSEPKILKSIHQNLLKIGLQVKALTTQPLRTSLTLKPYQIRQGLKLLHNTFQLDTLSTLNTTP